MKRFPTTRHDLLSPASQLQFIDLGLRATGDAAVARRRLLERIKTSNPAAIAEEINRLEKLPNRERILMQIGELRTLTGSTDKRQPEALGGAMLSLFNIRKIKEKKSDTLHRQIAQMESLFIGNRKNDYLQALSEATTTWHKTADDAPDSNISALFDLLREYGFPNYRLQLRFDEFLTVRFFDLHRPVFIILVAVLIGVSQLYLTDPVLIRYGQWQAEPPAGVAVATVLAVVISLVVFIQNCGKNYFVAPQFRPLAATKCGEKNIIRPYSPPCGL